MQVVMEKVVEKYIAKFENVPKIYELQHHGDWWESWSWRLGRHESWKDDGRHLVDDLPVILLAVKFFWFYLLVPMVFKAPRHDEYHVGKVGIMTVQNCIFAPVFAISHRFLAHTLLQPKYSKWPVNQFRAAIFFRIIKLPSTWTLSSTQASQPTY